MRDSSNTGIVLMSCQPHEEKKEEKEFAKYRELQFFFMDHADVPSTIV